MLHQNLGDFRPGKFGWQCFTCRQHLSNPGPGQQHEIFRLMIRYVSHHDHPVELPRIRGMVRLEYLNVQGAVRNLIVENCLRIERAIVISNTRVITTDYEMCTSCILAKDSV